MKFDKSLNKQYLFEEKKGAVFLESRTYPFFRYAIAFMLGIILAVYAAISWQFFLFISVFFVMAYCLAFAFKRRIPLVYRRTSLGLIGLLLCFSMGSFWTAWQQYAGYPKVAIQHLEKMDGYKAKVSDFPEKKAHSWAYTVQLKAFHSPKGWQAASGKVQVYLQRDSGEVKPPWPYGQSLLIKGAPEPFEAPINPGQFDYRHFMHLQQLYLRDFVRDKAVQKGKVYKANPFFWAMRCRRAIQQKFQSAFSPEVAGFAEALTIGVKEDLQQETIQGFASSGAMHVLAVSGLHVGILYIILFYALGFLKRKPESKWLFTLFISLALWVYAFLTGFPASITRAVIMFQLVLLGRMRAAHSPVFNSIAVAALILLLWQPLSLFSVGFQLSFLAVVGIVYLQPKFYRWWQPQTKVLDYGWQLFTVSLAAQCATFPLTLLYFHQFAPYFLLSNLLIIPLIGFVLGGLMLWLTLAFSWPLVAKVTAPGLDFMLHWFLRGVQSAQYLPAHLIQHIQWNSVEAVWTYALILMLLALFLLRKSLFAWLSLVLVLGIVGFSAWQEGQNYTTTAAYVLKAGKHDMLFFRKGKAYRWWSPKLQKEAVSSFYLDGAFRQWGYDFVKMSKHRISFVKEEKLVPFEYEGKQWLWVNGPLEDAGQKLQPDVVVLEKEVNVKTLAKAWHPEHWVLGTQLPNYSRKNLLQQLKKLNLPYYDMNTQGAFMKQYF